MANTKTVGQIIGGEDMGVFLVNRGTVAPDSLKKALEGNGFSIASVYAQINAASNGVEGSAHDGSTYIARVAAAKRMIADWPMAVEIGGKRVPIFNLKTA